MPDGYRRGGQVTRNGSTHYRRGTQIKPREGLLVVAGVAVGFTMVTGSTLVSTPLLLTGLCLVGVGVLVYRNRRRLRPVGKSLNRWATKHHHKRTGKSVAARTRPAAVRTGPLRGDDFGRADGAYLDAQSRPHAADGRFITDDEWDGGHSSPARQSSLDDPDTWFRTGGEPATEKQRFVLTQLRVPVVDGLTKAEASKLIKAEGGRPE